MVRHNNGATNATIDVAFTPGEARPAEVAIVVDVLRASSTIAAALAAGYDRVLCAGTVEQALGLRGPNRTLAGERGSTRIEDFDLGNSPRAFSHGGTGDLVLCTTNGTPAVLAAAAAAEHVIVASLLNLDAVIAAVPDGTDVSIVCSGVGGRFAIDDAYVAGRIAARLPGALTDAARAAVRLAGAYEDPGTPLAESAGAEVLRATGQAGDIAYCALESVLDTVPRVIAAGAGVAVVANGPRSDDIHRVSSITLDLSFT